MKIGERIKGEDLKWKTFEVCEGGVLKVVEDEFPKVGNFVWYVDQFGRVPCSEWKNDEYDLFFVKYNRIFPTQEIAQEYADFLKKKAELSFEPDWVDESQFKYYFGYGHKSNKWYIGVVNIGQAGQQLYFPSEECMNQLVESIGEEKFLYFEFGIPLSGSEDM